MFFKKILFFFSVSYILKEVDFVVIDRFDVRCALRGVMGVTEIEVLLTVAALAAVATVLALGDAAE